jgi:RNA polymerase sigma-70 factor (ECF subfamily)
VADNFDVEVELERGELIRLLDLAMGLLPPRTRQVLYEHIVAGTPLAETALSLGISEDAVAMRLQRGKLALRRILSADLYQEARDLGLFVPEDIGWQQTRLWCPYCGERRLEGRFTAARESLWLRCPTCGDHSRSTRSPHTDFHWDDRQGYRATFSRIRGWYRMAHVPGLVRRSVACAGCGHQTPLRVELLEGVMPMPAPRLQLFARCPLCGSDAQEAHDWLMLCLPEGSRFLRDRPRGRFAGVQSLKVQGRAAFITTYESVTDSARFDVVRDAETLRILVVHGQPPQRDPCSADEVDR